MDNFGYSINNKRVYLCALARAIKASGRRSSEGNTIVPSICMGIGVKEFNKLASTYLYPSDSQHELLSTDIFPHFGTDSLIREDQLSISFFTRMVQSIPVEGQVRVCSVPIQS